MSDEKTGIAYCITAHCWNKQGTHVAVCPNNEKVLIYSAPSRTSDSSTWTLVSTLEEHTGLVAGIDWSHENQIVTCGHDRNAYVWSYDTKENEWKPTLVVLRIDRAATAVKWSPKGDKFAVASGSKCVQVCYFQPENNWWIAKTIKKFKSTVTSVAWCINNKFIISGSCDFKARISSAYIKGLDDEADDGFGEVFPQQHEFGATLAEFSDSKSWVECVAWAANGFRLAFSGHGSTVHFVQLFAGGEPLVQTVYLSGQPVLDMAFLSDETLVAVGYDCNPMVFVADTKDGLPTWRFKEMLDKADEKAATKTASAFAGAKAMFSDMTRKGIQEGQQSKASGPATKHKAAITCLCPGLPDPKTNSVLQFSTSGLDGRLLNWDLKALDLKALKLTA